MSRKMVVAAVTAAGVVGFGSAAVATVGPLGLGEATDKVPGVSEVGDRVEQELGNQNVKLPGQVDLAETIDGLRSQLNSDNLSINVQDAELSGDRLEAALYDLAGTVRAGSARLSTAQAQGAERLASQLEGAANRVGSTSFESIGATGEAKVEETLTQLQTALMRAQQMDEANALNGAAGDVLDREKVEAQLQRVTSRLNSLLG